MKSLTVLLMIALCLLAAAAPVSGAKDIEGKSFGITIPPDDQEGVTGTVKHGIDEAGKNVSRVRETIRQEVREEIQEENRVWNVTGTPDSNRTREGTPKEITVVRVKVEKNVSAVRQDREKLNATLRNATPVRAGWSRNSNDVRLAVHTLLAMENMTGGIGPQVSAVAREFNNSAQQTWDLEERLKARDAFSAFLFGADQASVGELANLTARNQERIRQMEALMTTAGLDGETQALLQEQIRIMEQENARLSELSAAGKQNRGIFGWLGR